MWTSVTALLISARIVLAFRFINMPHTPPLLGIYQQKNKYYWFKFVLLVVVLYVRQWLWRIKRSYAVCCGKSGDGTIHVHAEDEDMEKKYDLGTYPQAIDAVFFNGISSDGKNAIEFAIARRQGNVCDALVYIKLDAEDYMSPKMPDTLLEQDKDDRGEYRVQGIQIESFIPMRTWKLSYNGEMKTRINQENTVKVKAELTWSALFAPFNYDYQMSPWCVARDMAREPWSRDYFSNFQKLSHSLYEQMGYLKGTVNVEGKIYDLKMPSFRDHSYGKIHDWRNLHRYVYHTLYLDNGDYIAIGCISQPIIMSHLTVGYVCRKSNQAILAVQSSDFKMYQHGENQDVPKDYGFSFKAGGQQYTVHITVDSEHLTYHGEQREAIFYNHWLSVDVNGVKGRGFGQWQYNIGR